MPPHKEPAVTVNLLYNEGVDGLSNGFSLREVNRIRDPNPNLTGMERKHLPLIVKE
jgi:hypothetical protein